MPTIPPITCSVCFILVIILAMATIGIIWIFKVRNERVFIKKEAPDIEWDVEEIRMN